MSTWIPISDKMPAPGKRVLVRFYNHNLHPQTTIGKYFTKHYEEVDRCAEDPEEWADLNEADNELYWPEGWWEDVRISEQVDSIKNVTHWQPLPSAWLEEGK